MEFNSIYYIPWSLFENELFGKSNPVKWNKDWLNKMILNNSRYNELIETQSFYISPEGVLVHEPETAYCRIVNIDMLGIHCVCDGCGLKNKLLEYFYDTNIDLKATNSYRHFVDHLEYEFSIEECDPGWVWDYTWLYCIDKDGNKQILREPN